MALGYSLSISELKDSISRNLIAEAREKQKKPGHAAECIRDALQGKRVSYSSSVTPWWSVNRLIEAIENRRADGTLIHHGGGYPFLFTARGRTIIEEIAEVEGSRHEELAEDLDPDELYFVEAWDLS